MNQDRKFVAVIPAYNESKHIGKVIEIANQFLPVLVVDDGSADDTFMVAQAAGAQVVQHTTNQGKGAALRTGFRVALAMHADAVITLDGDGQHNPEEITSFIQAYNDHPVDLIIGQRNFSKMPFSRRIANTTGTWLFSWAIGQSIPDNQSGFRLISQRFMQTLLEGGERGFEFEVEMLQICLKRCFTLEWIPIQTIYSSDTSHIKPLQHAVQFLRMIATTRRRMQDPLFPLHA